MVTNKKTKKVLITIIIALLLFSILSFFATKLIYDGIFTRYDCGAAVTDAVVASRRSFHYPSGDNTLSGYLYASNADNGKNTLIVLAAGHRACADSYQHQIDELLAYGWSVFAFDSTGCCTSEGDSSVGFPQTVLDLNATLDYLAAQDNFRYEHVALLGHSRGGYAACCSLAYGYDIAAVISVSGINSAMEGVIGAASQYVGGLAYGNYGWLWLYQTMLFGSDTVNLRADRVLSSTDTPVLLIHGADDTTVPLDKYSIISHREQIRNPNTEYLVCRAPDNAGHTDLLFDSDGTADDHLIKTIDEFLTKHIS